MNHMIHQLTNNYSDTTSLSRLSMESPYPTVSPVRPSHNEPIPFVISKSNGHIEPTQLHRPYSLPHHRSYIRLSQPSESPNFSLLQCINNFYPLFVFRVL
ncbi:hypothetical protein L6164_032108 [Bauhinia variegata]|uniref:Uncharacterized protein n=1 Tax=Bauhinia variegata TaxID=167791 RepID=A0ACB9KMQ5_BAUVA|nr:hypothetical protein L6164_032108 [Bauhinia variegata]